MKLFTVIAFGLLLILPSASNAQIKSKGFYKDLGMDGGVELIAKEDLAAARLLDLSMEKLVATLYAEKDSLTCRDTIIQNLQVCGNPLDDNGILLYPDGAPRFKVIYVNGGLASYHGRSLTETGRNNIKQYIENGGSYIGTCAGAFLGSIAPVTEDMHPYPSYLSLWPGYTMETNLFNAYTGVFVDKNSPLLQYYDFGGDNYIDSLRHYNGCYAYSDYHYPRQTEPLIRFDCDTAKVGKLMHNQTVAWAYKESDRSGRVILCGSHPENATSGERLDLMASFIRYCMDGNGVPVIKGELKSGEPRIMSARTADSRPEYTRIGDKQYHHFTIDVPKNTETLTVSLTGIDGWTDFDMYLFVNADNFAFADNSRFHDVALGVSKQIVLKQPKQGKYYISVYLATTVDTIETHYGTQYIGRTDVLNGVPYIIQAETKRVERDYKLNSSE